MPVTLVWNFIKKNWRAILLAVVLVIGYAWIRRQQAETASIVQQMNESHAAEVDKINKARVLEAEQHAQQLKALQESIAKIQADYVAAQQQLAQQQAAQRKEIVKKFSNDTEGLAQFVGEKLGLEVVPSGPP